jgi:hypothetical protein
VCTADKVGRGTSRSVPMSLITLKDFQFHGTKWSESDVSGRFLSTGDQFLVLASGNAALSVFALPRKHKQVGMTDIDLDRTCREISSIWHMFLCDWLTARFNASFLLKEC